MEFLRLPIYDALADAQTVLLAGAGGGYDIFTGLPLYFGLRAMGKTVYLANLSFTDLSATSARRIGAAMVEVTHKTTAATRYFPEKHLCEWFAFVRDESVSVYCFERRGAKPVAASYRNLLAEVGGVDAVVLVDGGTDSLMRGDEAGLGTPEEDSVSIFAANQLDVATRLLICVGFGVDTFHGVSHAHFLESVAALAKEKAYLGAWSLLPAMPEVVLYRSAVNYVHQQMFRHPSIVNSSLVSAIEGEFGDYHATQRTEGSSLFINPLMSLYWAFDLPAVARRNLYLDRLTETDNYTDVVMAIARFRHANQGNLRPVVPLPM